MSTWIILILIPMVLGIWAQMHVSSVYKKWSQVPSRGRITGAEAADAIMRAAGISDVEVVEVSGHLTDHYDPTNHRLALSSDNYRGTSLAALGVAAHEAGHALQHQAHYAPLKARMALIPVTGFASQILPFVIIGGFFFGMFGLIKVGVAIYLVLTVFQLITLPVEFDASRRAEAQLTNLGILQADEVVGVTQTLRAAGWTYVAAFVATLGNLLYLLMLSRRNN
ncbi:MAG: peptidase [Verrucomicrobia bacterium 21-51-4]|nr:MAG: peptidase [Verrucomicrobia bacterium 21-51-4]